MYTCNIPYFTCIDSAIKKMQLRTTSTPNYHAITSNHTTEPKKTISNNAQQVVNKYLLKLPDCWYPLMGCCWGWEIPGLEIHIAIQVHQIFDYHWDQATKRPCEWVTLCNHTYITSYTHQQRYFATKLSKWNSKILTRLITQQIHLSSAPALNIINLSNHHIKTEGCTCTM